MGSDAGMGPRVGYLFFVFSGLPIPYVRRKMRRNSGAGHETIFRLTAANPCRYASRNDGCRELPALRHRQRHGPTASTTRLVSAEIRRHDQFHRGWRDSQIG